MKYILLKSLALQQIIQVPCGTQNFLAPKIPYLHTAKISKSYSLNYRVLLLPLSLSTATVKGHPGKCKFSTPQSCHAQCSKKR